MLALVVVVVGVDELVDVVVEVTPVPYVICIYNVSPGVLPLKVSLDGHVPTASLKSE